MIFNTVYNDIYAFKNESSIDNLNKKYFNNQAREEYNNFINEKFPKAEMVEVFKNVSPGVQIYPYL
ncbi:hypothetical protein [Aliarcobacter cryaerophilus]|uniref:hypothetical protein n=1 Tax=Aliarcobacter cryaerophilus TaxID=28198 RepID=UPI003DA48803